MLDDPTSDHTVALALVGVLATMAGGYLLLGKKAWSLLFGRNGDGEGGVVGKGIKAVNDLGDKVETGMASIGDKVEGLGGQIDKVADHQAELLSEFRKANGD